MTQPLKRRNLQLEPAAELEPHEAASLSFQQADEAARRLALGADAFLQFPWPSLDAVVGGMAPADLWFLAGASGNGKTTFLLNLVDALLLADKTVYYLGLESRPHVLRTQLACQRLGIYAGDVLSGAARSWPNWAGVRRSLKLEIDIIAEGGPGNRFLVSGVTVIDTNAIRAAIRDAALSSADLIVIDHIDHIRGSGNSLFEESYRVTHLILELAHENNQRFLIATQCNNEGARGDRLGRYQPPQIPHVYMGSHKVQVATGMLGLFRPLKVGVSTGELADVRSGKAEPQTALEPNTMGVVVMKHRYYGNREGKRCQLRLDRGRLAEIPEKDRYVTCYEAEGPRV